MQQKKNIQLLMIWCVLLIITIGVAWHQPEANRSDIDPAYFALGEKVNELKEVTISGKSSHILLKKFMRYWKINDEYTVDPARVNDLLTILSEVSVRRKAASNIKEELDTSAKNKYTVNLSFADGSTRAFRVAENERQTLTYFIDDIPYVVNIPGYNFHIAEIFKLAASEWRSPYVFAADWSTLDKMKISYPSGSGENFEIVYDNMGYTIPGIDKLDTASMYDYMQQVSFLQVEAYLPVYDTILVPPDIRILVEDIDNRHIKLDFYLTQSTVKGRINDSEWAVFDYDEVQELSRSLRDFELKN